MEFEELANIIFPALKEKLEDHSGLSVFVRERAKFEGWLKVELCDILVRYSQDIIPERNRVDINFENWGIELKTVNTNIRYEGAINKHRPITKNTQGVIDDILNLSKNILYKDKAVLFIVFPIKDNNSNWQTQLRRITAHLREIKKQEFNFKNNLSGIIYCGLV